MIKELLLASTLLMPLNNLATNNVEYQFTQGTGELNNNYININQMYKMDLSFNFSCDTFNEIGNNFDILIDIQNNFTNEIETIINERVIIDSDNVSIKFNKNILIDNKYLDQNNYNRLHFTIINRNYARINNLWFGVNINLIPLNTYNYSLSNFVFNYKCYSDLASNFDKIYFNKGQMITTDNYNYKNINYFESPLADVHKINNTVINIPEISKQVFKEANFKFNLIENDQIEDEFYSDLYFQLLATNQNNITQPDTAKTDLIPIRACPVWYDIPCQTMNGLANIINHFPFLGDFLGNIKRLFYIPILATTNFLKGLFGL